MPCQILILSMPNKVSPSIKEMQQLINHMQILMYQMKMANLNVGQNHNTFHGMQQIPTYNIQQNAYDFNAQSQPKGQQ